MPAYEYVALDAGGQRRKGVAEGDSDRHVRQQLRDSGLTLLAVNEVTRRRGGGLPAALRAPRLRTEDLALLTRLLATLIRSGLPLDDALTAVAKQTDKAAAKRVVVAIRSRVLEGHSLARAMEQFPAVFPDIYLATVSAGEQTPHLGVVLERLADYIEERQQLQQKIQVAMLYPAILTITAVLIVAGLLTYVVPEVVKVFDHLDRELPALTRGLIALAGCTRAWGLYVFAGLAAAAAGARTLLVRPAVRARVHRVLLSLPIIGRLVREANAARLTRTLATLLRSGVSMLDALRISARALVNIPMREAVSRAAIGVQEGMPLHRALEQTRRLPPLTVHLIANGEASGTLELMLETAARTHERNVQTLLATLLALLEPLLILTMGTVVLLIVVAILLPIFDLNRLV